MLKKFLRSNKKFISYFFITFLCISLLNLIIQLSVSKQLEKELFYFLIITANYSYLYFFCKIKKLNYFFKEYKIVLDNLIKELGVRNTNINKKKELLDKVSFKGFLFLTYLLKFSVPYFLSLLIFSILNLSSIFDLIIVTVLPYFALLIKTK